MPRGRLPPNTRRGLSAPRRGPCAGSRRPRRRRRPRRHGIASACREDEEKRDRPHAAIVPRQEGAQQDAGFCSPLHPIFNVNVNVKATSMTAQYTKPAPRYHASGTFPPPVHVSRYVAFTTICGCGLKVIPASATVTSKLGSAVRPGTSGTRYWVL